MAPERSAEIRAGIGSAPCACAVPESIGESSRQAMVTRTAFTIRSFQILPATCRAPSVANMAFQLGKIRPEAAKGGRRTRLAGKGAACSHFRRQERLRV